MCPSTLQNNSSQQADVWFPATFNALKKKTVGIFFLSHETNTKAICWSRNTIAAQHEDAD